MIVKWCICSRSNFNKVLRWAFFYIFITIFNSIQLRLGRKIIFTNFQFIEIIVRDHPYITSAKGLGGSRKWPVLLTFSTCIYADLVDGWVRKSTKLYKRNIWMVPYRVCGLILPFKLLEGNGRALPELAYTTALG